MNCKISIDINKGKHSVNVSKYGANIATDMLSASSVFNESTFEMEQKPTVSFASIAKKTKAQKVLSSFFLTNDNSSFNSNSMRKIYGDKTVDSFIKLTLSTTEERLKKVTAIFNSNNKIKSTLLTENAPIVVEDDKFTADEDPTRDYISIDNTILKQIDLAIPKSIVGEERNIELNNLLSIFITSAFQRGYSVHIKNPLNGTHISIGAKAFNKANNGKNANYISSSQRTDALAHIIFSQDIIKTISNLDRDNTKKDKIVPSKDSGLLTDFLSEEDRIFVDKFKLIPLSSKAFIAGSIADVFLEFIPNLKVNLLTTAEIKETYNNAFSTKKGFIIGGEIVINLDTFTPDTMFHEMGHFYMKWLSEYNPSLKKKILNNMKDLFSSDIVNYTKIYTDTGIAFSEDDILEEIFTTKLGLDGFKGLSKVMDVNEIRSFDKKVKRLVSDSPITNSNLKGADIFFVDNTDSFKNTNKDVINMSSMDITKEGFFASLFQPVPLSSKSIVVGPFKNDSDVSIDNIKFKANMAEAASAYEYFLLNGVDSKLVKKYDLSTEHQNILTKQHAFILNNIEFNNLNAPMVENYINIEMGDYSFSEILYNFSKQLQVNEDLESKDKNVFKYRGRSIKLDFHLGYEQEVALKKAIDFTVETKHSTPLIIQGSAGTGKNTVIKNLYKYLKTPITYISPTHSSSLLAAKNLNDTITKMPRVINDVIGKLSTGHKVFLKNSENDNSEPNGIFIVDEINMINDEDVFWLRFNLGGFNKAEISNLTEQEQSFFYIPRNTPSRTLNALRSRFTLENETIEGEEMYFINTLRPSVKLVGLGDIKKISPFSNEGDSISKFFDTYNTAKIGKIYSAKAEDLLAYTNYVRKQRSFKPVSIQGTDESLLFVNGEEDMFTLFTKDLTLDRTKASFLTPDEHEVEYVNNRIKQLLDGTTTTIVGDAIVGYKGSGNKSIIKNNYTDNNVKDLGFAEDITYKVTNILKEEFSLGERVLQAVKLTGVSEETSSFIKPLNKTKFKTKNLYSKVTRHIIPLFSDDNINLDNMLEVDFSNNRSELADYIADKFTEIEEKDISADDVQVEKQAFITDLFTSKIDISKKIVIDLTTKKITPFAEINKLDGNYIIIEKGLDYNYAMDVYKGAGKNMSNVYIDIDSIQDISEKGSIYDFHNNNINDFKNSMFYTALSSVADRAVVYSKTNNVYSDEITTDEIGINEEESKYINRKVGETIKTYTRSFMKKLIGSVTLNDDLSRVADNGVFSILDMLDMAYTEGTEFTPIYDIDNMNDAVTHIKNFTLQKASIVEITNGLLNRGLITKTPDGRLVLKDIDGNYMDHNGNYIDGPSSLVVGDEDIISNEMIRKMYGYLNINKDASQIMFAVDRKVINTAIDTVKSISSKIARNDKGRYEMNGVELKGATRIIEDEFSDPFEVDQHVKLSIFYEGVDSIKKVYISQGMSEKEAENKAIAQSEKNILEAGPAFQKKMKAKKDVFEFKKEEGTYIHNMYEFFVMALNYSQSIEYKTKVKGYDYTYFLGPIQDAIVNEDRAKFEKYFQDNFFDRLKGETKSPEYIQFKKAFNFIRKNVKNGDLVFVDAALSSLTSFLKTNVYRASLPGPLTLMPEVVIGNDSMGIVGIVDLMVIDGRGTVHLYDYKTKEENKFHNWAYLKGNVRLRNEMDSYKNNAMTKASIQLSLYKLILKERGLDVGSTSVAYVEAAIKGGDPANIFSDPKKLKYKVKRIFKTSLIDVSADLTKYFKREGVDNSIIYENTDAAEITDFVVRAAGGFNIEIPGDIEVTAKRIYDRSIGRSKFNSEKQQAVQRILNMGGTDKKGLNIVLPGEIKHTIPKTIIGEKATIEYIVDLIKKRKGTSFIESDLESIFNSLDRNRVIEEETLSAGDKEKAIRGLLNGTDSSTYEFMKFSSDINYGTDFNGVSFLKNKITGEVRIIVLNPDEERFIPFREGYHNILGNYISTNALKAQYPTIAWTNTNFNMRLIKTGLMILRAKQLNPDFKVSMILMNRGFKTGNDRPIKVDMLELMEVTKAMMEEANKAGEELPSVFQESVNDYDTFNPNNYMPDPLLAVSDYIESLTSNNIDLENVFSKKGAERARAVSKIIKNYDETVDFQKLLDAVQDLQHSLELRISPSKRASSDVWKVLDDSILFLLGFNFTISPKNTSWTQKFFFMPSATSNVYMSSFNRKITTSNTAYRTDFIAYKKKFNILIQDLADENGVNISALGESLFRASMKDLMTNLFVDPTNTDKAKAYTLKSETAAGLNSAEKALIRFINEQMNLNIENSINRSFNIKNGWLPLIPRSKLSAREDTDALERAEKSLKSLYKIKTNTTVDNHDLDTSREKEFSTKNAFDHQIPGKKQEGLQFTNDRRYLLGIDEDGNAIDNNSDGIFEDNIENIVDAIVASSLQTVHFRDVSSFGRALFYNVKREEQLTGNTYDNILDVLTIIQRKNINNKTSDEKIPGLASLNKIATGAVIAGSINQMLLETFTNPLITMDNYLGDLIYGTIFKGQREFGLTSYRKAFNIVTGITSSKDKAVLEAIDLQYGFSNSDSTEMQKVLKMLEGNSIFQSHKLMYVNKLILESWQKITMAAYMIEQGSFYAHSLDGDGNLVYDDTKDKRFYGGSNTEYKDKFYKATKAKMATERSGLTGTVRDPYDERDLAKAYTEFDINYLKEKLVELYSSLDNSSKSMAIYYTWMSFITKMRTWLFAKMGRYFKKPMTAQEGASMSRLRRIKDDSAEGGYRLEWVGEASEGILFSVFGIGRLFMEYKFDMFKNGTVTEVHKKNMSKLIADMIVGLGLAAAAWGMFNMGLDDDDRKNPLAQIVYKRFMMATGDAFLIKSLVDTTMGNGSMFIGPAIIKNAFMKAGSAVWMTGTYGFNDDITPGDVGESYIRAAAGFYGPIKSGTQLYDIYKSFDD